MQRSESHLIDEHAEEYLKKTLPRPWVKRKQAPDYGIDFQIETTEKNSVTAADDLVGLKFGVQLKGKKSLRPSGSHLTFSMETKHLSYYVDHCREPIFLVVVDVEREEGYWLFVQEHVLTCLASTKWREQKTASVRIPIGQRLENTDQLHDAVKVAERYMAGFRPAEVRNAIMAVQKKWESLDPRMRVILKATEKSSHYELQALEPIHFQLTFKGNEKVIKKKVDDFFGRGLPVDISPEQVEVSGSPLLKKLFEQKLKLQQSAQIPLRMTLSRIGSDGQVKASLDPLDGVMEGGPLQQRVTAKLDDHPVEVSAVMQGQNGYGTLKFNIRFNFERWPGKRILHVPYLSQVATVFADLRDGEKIAIKISHLGTEMVAKEADVSMLSKARPVFHMLGILQRLKELSELFGVNPVLPSDMTDENEEAINVFHWSLTKPQSQKPGSDVKLSLTVRKIDAQTEISGSSPGSFKLTSEPLEWSLFGEPVVIPSREYELTEGVPAMSAAQLAKYNQAPAGASARLSFRGTPASTYIIRRDPKWTPRNAEKIHCHSVAATTDSVLTA
jgi:hypothetical protein